MKYIIPIILIIAGAWFFWPKTDSALGAIAPAGIYQSPEALKQYIKRSVLNGELPQFDVSQVDLEDVAKAYREVLTDYPNVDLTKADKDLFKEIRKQAKDNGEVVQEVKNI